MTRRAVTRKARPPVHPVVPIEDGLQRCAKDKPICRGGRAYVPARMSHALGVPVAAYAGDVTDIHTDHRGKVVVTITTRDGHQRSAQPGFIRIQRVNPTTGSYKSQNEETHPMAKKKATIKKINGKAPRITSSRAVSLAGVQPTDFFNKNDKGKVTWKPGHDAKFASMCKRIINGKNDADDTRLAKAKTLVGHEKVVGSAHLSRLVKAASKAL